VSAALHSCRSALAAALLVCGVLLGASASAARAQALPAATGLGGYISAGGGASVFQSDYGQRHLGGGFAFADVNPSWRYGVEGEVRFLRYNSDGQVTQTTYLGGPRVSLTQGRIRPYVKFLAGAGHITLPFNYAEGTFLTYAPAAGVDYLVTERFAVRADLQYQLWPKFPYGELKPYGLSAGIVFRLTPPERFPKGTRHRH
jgi:opacity protein-like surface antigen